MIEVVSVVQSPLPWCIAVCRHFSSMILSIYYLCTYHAECISDPSSLLHMDRNVPVMRWNRSYSWLSSSFVSYHGLKQSIFLPHRCRRSLSRIDTHQCPPPYSSSFYSPLSHAVLLSVLLLILPQSGNFPNTRILLAESHFHLSHLK